MAKKEIIAGLILSPLYYGLAIEERLDLVKYLLYKEQLKREERDND